MEVSSGVKGVGPGTFPKRAIHGCYFVQARRPNYISCRPIVAACVLKWAFVTHVSGVDSGRGIFCCPKCCVLLPGGFVGVFLFLSANGQF